MEGTVIVASYGQSHVGVVREENQDSIRIEEPPETETFNQYGALYAVADGMGGYSHGGVASSLALENFFSAFYGSNPGKPGQSMKAAMQNANLAVFQAAQRMGMVRMGTTLSAVNCIGSQMHIAHIGDSRVYLVRGGKATCLTQDHTTVGELVRMRLLAPNKVRAHEQRSILNKCLGMQLFIQPDITSLPIETDDYLILCSDGVWAVIEDDEFAQVALDIRMPQRISEALIETAMGRDSDDNISAITIHVQEVAPQAAGTRRGFGLGGLLRGRSSGKA
jgi:protein phosphatase